MLLKSTFRDFVIVNCYVIEPTAPADSEGGV